MNPRAEPSPHSASAPAARSWTTLRDEKARRLAAIAPWLEDGVLPAARIVDALETLIRPGDRVALEGDNQKQADFLSTSPSPDRRACASRNCWKTTNSKSARSIPMSSCTRGCL
jgi:hypothetical protein